MPGSAPGFGEFRVLGRGIGLNPKPQTLNSQDQINLQLLGVPTSLIIVFSKQSHNGPAGLQP